MSPLCFVYLSIYVHSTSPFFALKIDDCSILDFSSDHQTTCDTSIFILNVFIEEEEYHTFKPFASIVR